MPRTGWFIGALVSAIACSPKAGTSMDEETSTPTTSGTACTEIGCEDGLMIRVTPVDSWPHGAYRFAITYDGTTTSCTGSLPLPPCESRALSCDGREPLIGESGCALDSAAHAFGDIMFSSTPASVAVEVFLDDRSVGSGRFTPAYQTVQPNGPGCEPVCTSAAVELALAFE
jgi:hypothetical protein